MTSSGTAAPAPDVVAPDPTKHVKYVLGMILGAEDLDQDFAWHAGRSRWMARDALGYGTVNGLRVTVKQGVGVEPQVEVSCGSAITPRGELVRVTPTQCASLNKWLQHHAGKVSALAAGSPSSVLSAYVVLCFDTCETDPRPIPGEPCRDEADMMANSRIRDAFRLELRFEAPPHDEERAVREFVRWASDTVEIGDEPTEGPVETFLTLLRQASPSGSPLTPAFYPASPSDRFVVHRYDACAYLKAALRVWITELRPLWHQEFGACHGCEGQTTPTPDAPDSCLLLARLDIALGADGLVDATPVVVVEDDRPMLAHLRLVQEWAMCGPGELSVGGGGAPGARGPRGDQGDNGPAGPAGPTGPTGPVGPVGPAGPTGAAGPVGPAGPQGVQGAAGPAGAPGPIGAAGPAGVAGPVGAPGPVGGPGAVGPVGPIGPPGPIGPIGPAGPTGLDGARGPAGLAGPAGPAGGVGPVGPAGPPGAPGLPGPIGSVGPTGQPGPAGPVGATGAAGSPGAPGPVGVQGAAGPAGPTGPAGPVGPTGSSGPLGPIGPVGPAGPAGPSGPAGPVGAEGPQGPAGDPAALRGRVVELPKTSLRYAVVAAGVLSRAASMGNSFNGLKLVAVGAAGGLAPGELKFVYANYVSPARAQFGFQTIVKILPVGGDQQVAIVPSFVRFDDDGFVVMLRQGSGAPLDQATLERTMVMVEVSEYGKLVIP